MVLDSKHRSKLTTVFKQNLDTVHGLLWQYYINNDSEEIVHPAYKESHSVCLPSPPDSHSRVYLKTLHQETKNVVFIVDRSSALSSHQFRLSLSTLRSMLASVSNGDRVGIVLISSDNSIIVDVKSSVSCDHGKLITMTDSIKTDLLDYISRIGQEGDVPDVPLGLTFAYNILAKSKHRETDRAQIVMIMGKKFEDKTEEELDEIIFEIKKQKRMLKEKVALSFVMMQNIGQRMFPDREFIQRMIDTGGPGGRIHTLQSSSLVSSLGDWYTVSHPDDQRPVLVSLPSTDELTDTPTVTLSQRTVTGGVMALEVSLAEIIEDVYWVERQSGSRTFLMDVNGVTISHPDLSLSSVTKHLDISLLEPLLSGSSELQEMMTVPSGSLTVNSTEFFWNRLDNTEYILVILMETLEDNAMVTRLAGVKSVDTGGYQYHSLVTSGSTKLCRHMSEAASMQTAALYLAPAAFARPADHLKGDLTAGMRTQSYMAYLTDPTRLIANPGLKTGIRDEVGAVAGLVDRWKQQAHGSPLNNYIVRRRVVTPRGVQLAYPGAGAREGSDPSFSSMYRTASTWPHLVSLSPPHLDPGGAGYIITMASVVTTNNDTPVAVIQADFTQGYFHKIVNDSLYGDLCYLENITCFLMDHRGYLLTHPRLTYRDTKLTGLNVHLTHLEPGVATDLLSDKHPGLLTKSECRHHESGTRQRVFMLDLDTERVTGGEETCTQYSLERVAGTNLMLGLVTRTCEGSTSFCWCSTVDMSCLDCSRLAQDECECPCECTEDRDTGVCESVKANEALATCSPEYEIPSKRSPRFSRVRVDQLPACVHTDCVSRASEADCAGVLGCSWCQLAEDAVTPLSPEFCAAKERCYSGILSYPSPYALASGQPHQILASEAERAPQRASPIGPVAGGIMAFFALLAVTGYAYRRWSRGERRLLVNSSDQDRVIMDGGYEDDTPEDISGSGGHNNYGLHQSSGITVVSPYRMNPGYRRPGRGTDSDHGYSTMTPCGDADSEIMSCLGNGNATASRRQTERMRAHNPLSLQSVTSGVSSRTASPVAGGPQILASKTKMRESSGEEDQAPENIKDKNIEGMKQFGKNQIIVAATVHTVET